MGFETERKFLVTGDGYRQGATRTLIRQGFLNDDMERMVRVRIRDEDAFLTVKGPLRGATRREFEYGIPLADAQSMLAELCMQPLIEKYRYVTEYSGLTWEVDVFLGDNEGLIIAEIELGPGEMELSLPAWIGLEITGEKQYYNANLVRNPFRSWK